jgi:threonyl-tRNA synthetase
MKLSTRPESALGEKATWDIAEEALRRAMNNFCNIPEPCPDVVPGQTFSYDGTVNSIKKMKKIVETIAKKGPEALNGYTGPVFEAWELNAGDGAFYGPKIDIVVEDALKRRHQCATIQLDFQLPDRFGLKFIKATTSAPAASGAAAAAASSGEEKKEEKKDAAAAATPAPVVTGGCRPPKVKEPLKVNKHMEPNEERPVMIHRAIFGSLERCIAILTEHYAGKWPFWLSPRQIQVVPVAPAFFDFAEAVRREFHDQGYHADADLSSSTLDKKIRDAQIAQYNFIFVVGEKEAESKSVNIRSRDNKQHGTKTLEEVKKWLGELSSTFSDQF